MYAEAFILSSFFFTVCVHSYGSATAFFFFFLNFF